MTHTDPRFCSRCFRLIRWYSDATPRMKVYCWDCAVKVRASKKEGTA